MEEGKEGDRTKPIDLTTEDGSVVAIALKKYIGGL